MRRISQVVAMFWLAHCSALPPALAESADSDDADVLFRDAVNQMDSAHCLSPTLAVRAPCLRVREQFMHVYERSPLALGALRNRAFIEKSLGLLASAMRSFQELARVAPSHPDPARQQWVTFAQNEASELEPRVPVLVLDVRGATGGNASLALDGALLPLEASQSLRLDPGSHVLKLKVETRPEREIRIDLAERERARMIVDLSKDAAPRAVAVPGQNQPLARDKPARAWALGLGVAGGVVIASGLGFGTAAWIQKRHACGEASLCDPSGYAAAARSARWANVLVGTGLVVSAAGFGLFLLAPRATRTSLALEAAGVF